MYGPPQPPPPVHVRTGIPGFVAVLAVAGSLLAGCIGGVAIGSSAGPEPTAPAAAPEPEPSTGSAKPRQAAASPKPTKRRTTIPGAGTFRVPQDAAPGTYQADPAINGRPCYWARLENLTGTDNIIANNLSSGHALVTIRSTDKGFQTNGCTEWQKIS